MAFVRVEQTKRAPGRTVRSNYVNGRDGKVAKATLTAISNSRRGSGEGARGRGHRDPVDALGQAGRERRRVSGQGQPRERRRAAAEQQLPGRRRRRGLRLWLHRRGDRLPRQQGRSRGAPRAQQSTAAATSQPTARRRSQRAAPRPACRTRRSTTSPSEHDPGRAHALPNRAFTIDRRNHHVHHPDSRDPLRPQHLRRSQRDARSPKTRCAGRRRPSSPKASTRSRSERYTYIPTIDVLRGLRKEGFEPFMVAQSKSRIEGKTEFTKHMIRMRHAGQVSTRPEANEIILINSHDGASSLPDARGRVPLRLLQRPGGRRRRPTTSASRTRATSRAR